MSAITLLSRITTGSRILRVLAASLSRGFGFRLNDFLAAQSDFCSCHSVLSIDLDIIAHYAAGGAGGGGGGGCITSPLSVTVAATNGAPPMNTV